MAIATSLKLALIFSTLEYELLPNKYPILIREMQEQYLLDSDLRAQGIHVLSKGTLQKAARTSSPNWNQAVYLDYVSLESKDATRAVLCPCLW